MIDIFDLRQDVCNSRYAVEVQRARGGSPYLYNAVAEEVSRMTDAEIQRYAEEAGLIETDEDAANATTVPPI